MIIKQRLVVLSGAGISQESGFETFRDAGGLWEKYPVEQVATPEGWLANPNLVTDFYNGLRTQLLKAQPNRAHRLLGLLEQFYDVTVVTQNVDDLHERGGSTKVIHLHGELMKVCSSDRPNDSRYIRSLSPDAPVVAHGTLADDGSLLRPWIVWFGESVPNIEPAAEAVMQADIFVIVGTSLNVYPAAGLVRYAKADTPVFLIDPAEVKIAKSARLTVIQDVASRGMEKLCKLLLPEVDAATWED